MLSIKRIIISIFLGVVTVLGINLQYVIRHPEEKLFGSTGIIIFMAFASLVFALVFLLFGLFWFPTKKRENSGSKPTDENDDYHEEDGRPVNFGGQNEDRLGHIIDDTLLDPSTHGEDW